MVDKVKTPAGIPDLTKSEVDAAKKDGAKDFIKDGVAGAMAADTGTTGDIEKAAEEQAKQFQPDTNTTFIAEYLDLGLDAFEDAVKEKADPVIPEDTIKGILALERNGKNRTQYVKALCSRLKVKSPYEVYHGGPAYTNDVSTVTVL